MNKPNNTEEYIATFPEPVRRLLEELRQTIKSAAPQAKEVISYGMPAFKMKGVLVYFAGYEKHIGFYPTGSGIEAFKTELTPYKWSKGTVQLPLNKPLPLDLITRMVQYRVMRDGERK